LPRAIFDPAQFSAGGNYCRADWANTSTFQKSGLRKASKTKENIGSRRHSAG
jgi:hypothetical protein